MKTEKLAEPWIIAAAILMAFGTSDLPGEQPKAPPPPDSKDLVSVVSTLMSYLQSIKSWDLAVTATPTLLMNKVVDNADGQATGTGRFCFAGDHYRMEDHLIALHPTALDHHMSAFDGETQGILTEGTGELAIRKIQPDFKRLEEIFYWNKNPVLTGLEFLSPEIAEGGMREFSIPSLQRVAVDAFCKRVISIEKKVADGDVQWILNVQGGTEHFTQLPSTYRVCLCENHGMLPLRWERYSSQGNIVFEYAVETFDKAKSPAGVEFVYPSAICVSYFGGSAKHPAQQTPLNTTEWRAKLNLINAPLNPELFSIDPALANDIYDMNNNLHIQVPK